MKRIERYCADGVALAQVIQDLYANYDTVTVLSVPALELAGYYSFGVSVDGGEFENSIFIGGHCYQLTEATGGAKNRCTCCALRDRCPGDGGGARCAVFSDRFSSQREFERYHFEKVKTHC